MGAQLRVYKQKISSAQTTKKITKAMELIAASRIQKAMARVRAASPFARAVTSAVSAVATHSSIDHPLTTERENIRRSAVVIFTSDRGLAGAFNSQILREGLELAELLRTQGKEVVFYLVGRKAVGYFQFRRMPSAAQWVGDTDTPQFSTAERLIFSGSRVSGWSTFECVATADTALVTARAKGLDALTRAIAFWMREAAMSSIAFVIFLVV